MYITSIPNRSSPPAILLREAFRENGKVRNRTLANLPHWPPARIEALRRALRGDFDQAALAFHSALYCLRRRFIWPPLRRRRFYTLTTCPNFGEHFNRPNLLSVAFRIELVRPAA